MEEPIPALDDRLDTPMLVEKALGAADPDEPVAADAEPRTFVALADRPARFEGFFVPQRRQCPKAVPTYTALTHRPADFEGCFIPQRRQCAEHNLPMYKALTEPPSDFTVEVVLAPSRPCRFNRVRARKAPPTPPKESQLTASDR